VGISAREWHLAFFANIGSISRKYTNESGEPSSPNVGIFIEGCGDIGEKNRAGWGAF
jgi:hypothetical protein